MAKAARMSVWLEETESAKAPRGRRTEQPSGLDRDRITGTTVRLLDAEGLAKFSMRRLAGELGVTAMSVYWYVDTKDDLLELALDRVFGELTIDEDGPSEGDDWREWLRDLATAYRSLIVRHPWISPLAGNYLNIGPNALRFSFAVQRIVARTGLSLPRQRGAIASVFQFVYGYGTIEGHFRQRCVEVGMTRDEYYTKAMSGFSAPPEMADAVRHAEQLMAEGPDSGSVDQILDGDFEVALELQIAGIEALVARERAA
ncbi:TetR/AcrR family transcriptional regulator [Streptomyces xanthii]|uniref:TetR/AcrR family transcriptional regulator n=1 Tax=Streptomyces xanthii TaxID=2768069 RepID=A0A7H1B8W0_9ACTN|nr:TetR/AcrR family transcriptional regulator [Streptomyces xanthii]QNS05165.1 TetR/AcrR family transcriptional regulator [Streptomyces xanthii]